MRHHVPKKGVKWIPQLQKIFFFKVWWKRKEDLSWRCSAGGSVVEYFSFQWLHPECMRGPWGVAAPNAQLERIRSYLICGGCHPSLDFRFKTRPENIIKNALSCGIELLKLLKEVFKYFRHFLKLNKKQRYLSWKSGGFKFYSTQQGCTVWPKTNNFLFIGHITIHDRHLDILISSKKISINHYVNFKFNPWMLKLALV